jgi:hypothetical protein
MYCYAFQIGPAYPIDFTDGGALRPEDAVRLGLELDDFSSRVGTNSNKTLACSGSGLHDFVDRVVCAGHLRKLGGGDLAV